MGGKVWSRDEERVFWLEVIPRSPKRIGVDKARPKEEWDDLAVWMRLRMGEKALREYTGLMLFEHYFQNSRNRKYSPNGGKWARAYAKKAAEEAAKSSARPPRVKEEQIPTLSCETAYQEKPTLVRATPADNIHRTS
ncbi:hypothetical protein NKR23_g5169 [Pleurostoma richardsiae]|uniref:Uncharacterized protein n=1 Tax=Pleurostoma richardsiae TaxID=41990 RepID=A0AA38VUE8_9PEZI|nr:hypothetical protein NKR23_g5169 [Pleurostoma richardsiae]